jgi:LemA protein
MNAAMGAGPNWNLVITLALLAFFVFWAAGAKQRLMGLRNRIDRAFEPVQAQMAVRYEALMQWSVALLPLMDHDTQPLQVMQAALLQSKAACDVAAGKPHLARPIATLRLAEEALAAARQRLAAELPASLERATPGGPGMGLALIQEELANADAALGFARQQFNSAAQDYNDAVLQFPTWVIAGLFRFRVAGVL